MTVPPGPGPGPGPAPVPAAGSFVPAAASAVHPPSAVPTTPPRLRAALDRRLAAGLAALGRGDASSSAPLHELLTVARDPGRDDVAWLALACVLGRLPTVDEVFAARRRLDLDGVDATAAAVLAQALVAPGRAGLGRRVTVVTDPLVLTGDAVAGEPGTRAPAGDAELRHLEAQVLPRWRARGRTVGTLDEEGWVRPEAPGDERWARAEAPDDDVLLLPWHATVVLLPASLTGSWPTLAAVARFSGSRVVVVGPDLLPLARPDAVPARASEDLADALALVKHAHRVVTLGEAAAAGHRGFAAALAAQGLPGPQVRAVAADRLLDSPGSPIDRPARTPARTPVRVVSVADDAVSAATVDHAVDRLRDEGLHLEVRRVGDHGAADGPAGPAPRALRTVLTALGRRSRPAAGTGCVVALGPGGHGLLLREAMAAGLPAVLADRGLPAEVATGGGAWTVDPDDDGAVVTALRALLDDPATRDRLGAELADRPRTTWAELAEDLWTALTDEGVGTP